MLPAGIGRGELEILRYVSDHHPVSVREVADHVAETKGHTRTTVLNVMERLRKKGFLTRKKVGSVYVYSPALEKPDLLRGLVRDFVSQALGGSLAPFVAYLAEEATVTDADLAELRQLVQDLEEGRIETDPATAEPEKEGRDG